MVKTKLIKSGYEKELGISYATVSNKYGEFTSVVYLNPIDKEKNRESTFAGCRFAHMRANAKNLKEQIKASRYRLKSLTELLAEFQNSDNVNINSIESKKLKRKIKEEINKYKSLKEEYNIMLQDIEKAIKERDKFFNKYNKKKNKVKNN